MEGQYELPNTMTELEMCKTALCFKEHELFALRADVQTQHAIIQTLSKSVERLDKTMAAGMDRLSRSVNRMGCCDGYNNNNTNNKRRRREN